MFQNNNVLKIKEAVHYMKYLPQKVSIVKFTYDLFLTIRSQTKKTPF